MSLLRSTVSISALTLISRIFGLIRDVLVARAFGAGPLSDAFWVAFRIPNLLRRLFAEGAFSQAFVPILGHARATQSEEEVRVLLDRVALLLTVILTIVTVIGMVASPWVVMVVASGLRHGADHNAFQAASTMTRIMFPYILCQSLIAFASGVLNTWRRFGVPAFTPILLNFSMIAACLWLAPRMHPQIYALAIGVMVGGVAQLAMQWVALIKLGLFPRYSLRIREAWQAPTVKRILQQMVPATLGVSVSQVSLLINTNIATWLPAGSVTWLSYSDRLMEFPTSLLGVALGTVLLPHLSAAHASKNMHDYSALLDWGLRLMLLLGLPSAIGMGLLSQGLVSTLFNYGKFNVYDVVQTQHSVIAYSIGLLGLLTIKILAPGFYASQDIRTPVKIGICVLILTQLFNAALVPIFHHAGLAASIGLAACVNALALLIGLLRRGIYQPRDGWGVFMLRLLAGIAVMGGVLYWVDARIQWLDMQGHSGQRVLLLLGLIALSSVVYFATLFACGVRGRDFSRRAAPGLAKSSSVDGSVD